MDWIVVRKYPLDKKLDAVVNFLHERGVEFRIYEENSFQVLAIFDAKLLSSMNQFLDDVENGKIVLDISSSSHKFDYKLKEISLVAKAKLTPITTLLIFFSFLGAAVIALDGKYFLSYWFLFQEVFQDPFSPTRHSFVLNQPWRLITPAFLHFGLMHVVFNSLWMWELGRRLELFMGKFAFFLFFLVAASLSNIAQYLWAPHSLFGGMSGVVYALVGFIIVSQKLVPNPLTDVPKGTLIFMLVWLVICMTGAVQFIFGAGIANAAHIGGLIAGLGFSYITIRFNLIKFNFRK